MRPPTFTNINPLSRVKNIFIYDSVPHSVSPSVPGFITGQLISACTYMYVYMVFIACAWGHIFRRRWQYYLHVHCVEYVVNMYIINITTFTLLHQNSIRNRIGTGCCRDTDISNIKTVVCGPIPQSMKTRCWVHKELANWVISTPVPLFCAHALTTYM